MTKRVVAHVGFHKTGTTALQESFSVNRVELKRQGVIYPNFGQNAHHRAAWALIGRSWGWKNRGGKVFPIAEWKKLARAINRRRGTVLVSSEFFCELPPEKIQQFKADVSADQITIVFTIRPLLKLLNSSYQQYLKYGLTPTYEEWLHSVLDEPGVSKLTPTFWKRHDHGKVIAEWAKVFGAKNIVVVVANEKEPSAIFDAFNEVLALQKDTLTQVEGVSSNRSLSYEEISLLLQVNKEYPKSRNWSDYAIYIRTGAIRHLTDNVKPDESVEKLLTPEWAVSKAREISNQSVAAIKASGVNIIGSLDGFESATIPTGENLPISGVSLHTAAQALIGMKQELLHRHSSVVIFKEGIRRIKRKLRG